MSEEPDGTGRERANIGDTSPSPLRGGAPAFLEIRLQSFPSANIMSREQFHPCESKKEEIV